MTVADAQMGPVAHDMRAGDHYAQRFSNAPANPKPLPGLDPSDEARTVQLQMAISDPPGVRYTMVHPAMVGDYKRAGWSEA